MPLTSLVLSAEPRWIKRDELRDLHPGAHVAVFATIADVGIEGRLVGLELRDTLLVLRSGPKSGFCFLFRKPLLEQTVADQMALTSTGALNIEDSRVDSATPIQKAAGALGGYHGSTSAYLKGTGAIFREGGRWPPNVVLVHGPGCQNLGRGPVPVWRCGPDCPGPHLHARTLSEEGVSRFYPQLADDASLRAWILNLVM